MKFSLYRVFTSAPLKRDFRFQQGFKTIMGDGKGPRWIGDDLPELPPELDYAQKLPPKVTDKYVLFFGFDRPEPECCLQQWYYSPFVEKSPKGEERHFHTSEQYMMFHKALVMGDEEVASKILEAKSPKEAKGLGREVRNFVEEKWMKNCDKVVEEGNYLKFEQNKELGDVLKGTGQREIVETSPNDRFWGIGYNTEDALDHINEWGENRLGKCLMKARERLKQESYSLLTH